MTATDTRAVDLGNRIMAAVVADQRVPMASLDTPEEAVLRVRAATLAMDWAMAAMPVHQLVNVGRYLRSIVDQEPVRSDPLYEPQRVLLGLFLLALRDIVRGGQAEGEVAPP